MAKVSEKSEMRKESEYNSSLEGLGIAGFTLGVLSIVLAGLLGVVISIIGLSFCMVQQRRHRMKLAKMGVILNVIGLIVSIALVMFYIGQIIPMLQQQLQGGLGQ